MNSGSGVSGRVSSRSTSYSKIGGLFGGVGIFYLSVGARLGGESRVFGLKIVKR